MITRAPRQSAAQWSQIIAEFNRSGVSVEDFCTQRGYATSTFSRWRLRFSKPAARPVPATKHPDFVEALSTPAGSVTITLGDTVRIECPLSLGIEHIALLAKAVAADERI